MKSEFTSGIFNLIRSSTLVRAIIYTIGHIVIAATSNIFITGADVELAALDALIEPIINGFWYYLLDYIFVQTREKKNG